MAEMRKVQRWKANLFVICACGLWLSRCTTSQSPGSLAPPPPGGGKANPAANKPPQVTGDIEIWPSYVTPGQKARAKVSALDTDKGDKISYDWIITGGTVVEGANSEVVEWVASEGAQRVTLKVIVKDSNNAYTEKVKTVDLTKQFILFDVPPKPVYTKGSVMPLKVYGQSVENLFAFGFQLRYDFKKLELLSVNPATSLGKEPVVVIQQEKPGEVSVAFAKTGGEPVKGNLEIATIAFQALEDLPADAGPVVNIVPGTDFPTAKGPDGKELPVGYRFSGKPVVDQPPAPAPADGALNPKVEPQPASPPPAEPPAPERERRPSPKP